MPNFATSIRRLVRCCCAQHVRRGEQVDYLCDTTKSLQELTSQLNAKGVNHLDELHTNAERRSNINEN
ncbi:MAG: hypothetical protein BGO77_05895 [Caedibacter sp. 37-49]|nr:MAG: hypothetical protein BGO77_05895 [Caedibacter sp. 37-49]